MNYAPGDRVAYTRDDGTVVYGTVCHLAPDPFFPEVGVVWDTGGGACTWTKYLRKLTPLELLAEAAG